MEWIWIGMMMAIGWFLAPYVIVLVMAILMGVWEGIREAGGQKPSPSEARKTPVSRNEQIIEGEIVDEKDGMEKEK